MGWAQGGKPNPFTGVGSAEQQGGWRRCRPTENYDFKGQEFVWIGIWLSRTGSIFKSDGINFKSDGFNSLNRMELILNRMELILNRMDLIH